MSVQTQVRSHRNRGVTLDIATGRRPQPVPAIRRDADFLPLVSRFETISTVLVLSGLFLLKLLMLAFVAHSL